MLYNNSFYYALQPWLFNIFPWLLALTAIYLDYTWPSYVCSIISNPFYNLYILFCIAWLYNTFQLCVALMFCIALCCNLCDVHEYNFSSFDCCLPHKRYLYFKFLGNVFTCKSFLFVKTTKSPDTATGLCPPGCDVSSGHSSDTIVFRFASHLAAK